MKMTPVVELLYVAFILLR